LNFSGGKRDLPSPGQHPISVSTGAPGVPPIWGDGLYGLLKLSRGIDLINTRFGVVATWLVLIACLVSAGNAASRYLLSESSNGWLEAQWYMFAAMVLLGAPYTLRMNEHVRVDLIYSSLAERTRLWIDIIGGLLFLIPICVTLIYFTWPWFVQSWNINEMSPNAGGLVRWPVKLLLPIGFGLMILQGISEIIKRVASLMHVTDEEFAYEKPLQ
jgi:TRAP-type mannitol/chloroaromatic compound transport system permease small subunit